MRDKGKGMRLVLSWFCLLALAPVWAADPVVPREKIQLFNGRDLTHFYTWLASPGKGAPPYGKNNDPEKVFTVHDGMIHVSGKVFGGLITEKEYADYHLVVEFRWGSRTWPPREKAARDSGILLHCTGQEGAAFGVWMESIECQIIEGGTGDFILVAGKNKPQLTVEAEQHNGEWYYRPGAPPRLFTSGRINWYGRDPAWQDRLGFRGRNDVEHPLGQWNRVECICAGDSITNMVNGKVVNRGHKASHTRGKILLQSEGAEIFFRTVELYPLSQ